MLELERLACVAKLQVGRAAEVGPDILQVLLEVPERERHGGDPTAAPKSSGAGPSGLLRQPHGFESLGVIPEVLDHDDLAATERRYVGDVDPRVRSATDAVQHVMSDDPVAGFGEADRLEFIG